MPGGSYVPSFLFGGDPASDIDTTPQNYWQQLDRTNGVYNNPGPDTTASEQTRGKQNQLAGMLFNTAQGTQAGAGEMAVNRQIAQAQAAQAAQAASSRGANAALANRQVARTGADLAVNGAGQAAQAQLSDATGAQSQLAGLLGTTRQQDLGTAQMQQDQQKIKLQALAQYLGISQANIQNQLQQAQLQANPDRGAIGGIAQGIGGLLAAI